MPYVQEALNTNQDDLHTNEIVNIEPSNVITSPCISSSKITSRKARSLSCSKGKGLVHLKCIKLPAYMLYALESSNRKYTCYTCTETPGYFIVVCNECKTQQRSNQEEILRNFELILSEINLKNDKVDLPNFTSQINKMVTETRTAISRLENKYQELVESIESTFDLETWCNK